MATVPSLTPIPLIDRLRAVADLWCTATGRSPGALSSLVTNHGSFFERIGTSRSGANTTTLEKFAQFLAAASNWPDGEVPEEALVFAHVTGVTPEAAGPSPDSDGENIDTGGGFPPVASAGGSPAKAANAPAVAAGDPAHAGEPAGAGQ